jgi:hypothetical protein
MRVRRVSAEAWDAPTGSPSPRGTIRAGARRVADRLGTDDVGVVTLDGQAYVAVRPVRRGGPPSV